MRILIIKCWLTRHHWLLRGEEPVGWYLKKSGKIGKMHESIFYYQCTVCGVREETSVMHIGESPKTNGSKLPKPILKESKKGE